MGEEAPGRERDAYQRALEALATKERTAGELGGWLARRGFSLAEIEAAVERLTAGGALDDAEFARRFAEDKRELRGWGPDRIREALGARGLDHALIEAALAADGHDEQLARAIGLLERGGQSAADEPSRARSFAFLARRGFDSDVAYDAVRSLERRAAG
jgi:regulatory protein